MSPRIEVHISAFHPKSTESEPDVLRVSCQFAFKDENTMILQHSKNLRIPGLKLYPWEGLSLSMIQCTDFL